jgi:16S rRNA (adenine1518-N6/adenine1519-N6)-dimethyltransferase
MKAKRSLGQNFLVGSHYPRRIVDSVSPRVGETIIEIGPGRGALTGLLIESKAQIYSVELDHELIPDLTERFAQSANFRLIEGDALELDFCELIAPVSSARVVANLPYNTATAILQHLIGQRRCLREMTLMLQREVVDRLTAGPGGKEYGYLSVLVQFYCETEKLFDVPPGAFRPVPKVYSSVVRLRFRPRPLSVVQNEGLFLELTKVLFAHRRKTILNNLRSGRSKLGVSEESLIGRALDDASIDAQRRAETLSIEEIARLTNAIGTRHNPTL